MTDSDSTLLKRVLIYENRKTDGPIVWDASTPTLEERAYLALFAYLDEDWGVYSELEHFTPPSKPAFTEADIAKLPDGKVKQAALQEQEDYRRSMTAYQEELRQKRLYDESKAGNPASARMLLRLRGDYEYEEWRLCTVEPYT